IYGLDFVKEQIVESYCAMLINPDYKKKNLAFVGPAGVGKTKLGKTIAESIGLPFSQISFGNIKDANVLIGHTSTYIGSQPGLFINILKETKSANSVILLDEIEDRKSTRLNSSHRTISYAVFCL